MRHLLLLITGILLTSCGSRTYVERPVVVERPAQPPVVVEHERVIDKR